MCLYVIKIKEKEAMNLREWRGSKYGGVVVVEHKGENHVIML